MYAASYSARKAMNREREFMRGIVIMVLTAAAAWLLFQWTLRVESVHMADDCYLVEVSVCGDVQVHEVSR